MPIETPDLTAAVIRLPERLIFIASIYSALKIQPKEERGQLQRSIKWLTTKCDALLQCYNDQALELFGRMQAAAALKDGTLEALKASEKRAYNIIELN